MRVIINAQGSQGDVNPVLPLARALREDGHEVTICSPVTFKTYFSGHGIDWHEVGPDTRRWLASRKDQMATARGSLVGIINAIRGSFAYYSHILPPLAEGADVFLGAGVDLCGRSVAEHMGIPYRYLACVPQLFRSRAHPPMASPLQPTSRSVNHLLWSLNDFVIDKLVGFERLHNVQRAELGLRPVGSVLAYMAGQAIVATDPELSPVPPDVRAEYTQVGYIHDDRDTGLDPELERFLDAGSPPVFIGFGSMPGDKRGRIPAAVREVIESGRYRVVLSRGWGDLEPGTSRDGVFVVDYVPYLALFSRVAVVVHHGGSGTTHCAARAGVPQVVVPHLLDQFYWGARIHRLRLGPKPLKRSRLTGRALLAGIDEALAGPGCTRRARALGVLIRTRDPLAKTVRLVNRLAGN